jgi:Protein of unknown function (DUF3800)
MEGMQKYPSHKLYCYVDETGQDTVGNLFIVAVVVTDNRRNDVQQQLEAIEQASGKRTKWAKTSDRVRQAYCEALFAAELPAQLYTKTFRRTTGSYDELEVLAAAQAITLYREAHHITDKYKVTIAIDGLAKGLVPRIGRSFRLLGVKVRNVHGERDEASPIIRLADAIAGLVREAHEGREQYVALKKQLRDIKRLYEL